MRIGWNRVFAAGALGLVLAGCQTTDTASSNPVEPPASTRMVGGDTEPAGEGGIIDERAEARRSAPPDMHRVSRESYQEAMKRIDPQLATAAHQLVIARGLMKSCRDEAIMTESGMTRYFDNTERIFGILFRRAFQMEVGRLNARGLPPDDAVLGLVLTREATMDATGQLIRASRLVESQATRQGRELTDSERLTISCAVLAQGGERRTITRRISTPLLEYFVMMRHAHPSLFESIGEGEELIENVRLLTRI